MKKLSVHIANHHPDAVAARANPRPAGTGPGSGHSHSPPRDHTQPSGRHPRPLGSAPNYGTGEVQEKGVQTPDTSRVIAARLSFGTLVKELFSRMLCCCTSSRRQKEILDDSL